MREETESADLLIYRSTDSPFRAAGVVMAEWKGAALLRAGLDAMKNLPCRPRHDRGRSAPEI